MFLKKGFERSLSYTSILSQCPCFSKLRRPCKKQKADSHRNSSFDHDNLSDTPFQLQVSPPEDPDKNVKAQNFFHNPNGQVIKFKRPRSKKDKDLYEKLHFDNNQIRRYWAFHNTCVVSSNANADFSDTIVDLTYTNVDNTGGFDGEGGSITKAIFNVTTLIAGSFGYKLEDFWFFAWISQLMTHLSEFFC